MPLAKDVPAPAAESAAGHTSPPDVKEGASGAGQTESSRVTPGADCWLAIPSYLTDGGTVMWISSPGATKMLKLAATCRPASGSA
jgi:hypothetical protein